MIPVHRRREYFERGHSLLANHPKLIGHLVGILINDSGQRRAGLDCVNLGTMYSGISVTPIDTATSRRSLLAVVRGF